jgi:ABC-type antimicrobial peptide transport system permease subunit
LVFDGLELILLFVTILIGMIAAIFPAIAAYRLDISKTLKNKI